MSSNKPELDAMASRFIELWQEQMYHLANSPESAAMMSRMAGLMQQPNPLQKFFNPEGSHDTSSPFRSAPAAAALDALARQLEQLTRRVDAISEQLAPQPKPRAAKPRAKPAAAKPKPARPSTDKGRARKAK